MPTSRPSFTTGSRRIRRSAISALASQSCASGEVVSIPRVVAMSPKRTALGSFRSASTRRTRSRSVTTPTRRSPR